MFEAPPVGETQALAPRHAQRAGELTAGWRVTMIVGWIGVMVGFAAVWNSSWKMGLSTWWLGPEADPRFVLLLVLPFLLPIAVAVAALRRARWVPFAGIGAAIGTALIAWGDVGRVDGFAAVEFGLAAGGLLISLAALTGILRPAGSSVPSD